MPLVAEGGVGERGQAGSERARGFVEGSDKKRTLNVRAVASQCWGNVIRVSGAVAIAIRSSRSQLFYGDRVREGKAHGDRECGERKFCSIGCGSGAPP